jgi:hypothetical protein
MRGSLYGLWPYTMLTPNTDAQPLMCRIQMLDPELGPQQYKRSVVAIAIDDVDAWLFGTVDVARPMVRAPSVELFDAGRSNRGEPGGREPGTAAPVGGAALGDGRQVFNTKGSCTSLPSSHHTLLVCRY